MIRDVKNVIKDKHESVCVTSQQRHNTTMLAECCVVLWLSLTASSIPTLNLSKGCQCAIRKVIAESAGGPCPRTCSNKYQPVWGFNPCEEVIAESAGGPCPRTCSNKYQPVCGFNPCEEDDYPDTMFRTFDNECELEATICDGPGFLYQRVYTGTCVMDHQDDTSCLFVPH